MDSNEIQLWDRQSGEPSVWYERFRRHFLIEGRRSVLGAQKRCAAAEGRPLPKKQLGTWRRAGHKYNWEMRADKWAEYQIEQEAIEWQRNKRKATKDAFASYTNMLRKGAHALFNDEKPLMISNVGDAIKAIETGAKGVLLMTGNPTETIENRHTGADGGDIVQRINLELLSKEEKEQLADALRKLISD